jgi:hypothetical protein
MASWQPHTHMTTWGETGSAQGADESTHYHEYAGYRTGPPNVAGYTHSHESTTWMLYQTNNASLAAAQMYRNRKRKSKGRQC